MVEWVSENWGAIYGIGALVVGAIVWVGTFFGLWAFAANQYHFNGLILGWIPSAVAASVAAPILAGLWPLAALVAVWLALNRF